MRSFLISFLVSAAAGVVGVRIAAWVDQRYRGPATSFASHAAERFPHGVMLRTGATALVIAWALIPAAVLSVVVSLVGGPGTASVFVTLLGLFFGCAALYVTAATVIRCPKCDKRVFDQPSRPPYPEKFGGLIGFGATALRVTVRHEFRCVHCGQRFVLNSIRDKRPA